MSNIYIVTGKAKEIPFIKTQLESIDRADATIIGVDSGVDTLVKAKIAPDLVIGDFDSLSHEGRVAIGLDQKKKDREYVDFDLLEYQIIRLNPVKDDTDTEAALKHCFKYIKGDITIFGATYGNRIDHLLGNIALIGLGYDNNRKITLVDAHNMITLNSGETIIEKDKAFGKFISIIPYDKDLESVTLAGFKYNLDSTKIKKNSTLGISNEIIEDKAIINCQDRYLLIQSKD